MLDRLTIKISNFIKHSLKYQISSNYQIILRIWYLQMIILQSKTSNPKDKSLKQQKINQ